LSCSCIKISPHQVCEKSHLVAKIDGAVCEKLHPATLMYGVA